MPVGYSLLFNGYHYILNRYLIEGPGTHWRAGNTYFKQHQDLAVGSLPYPRMHHHALHPGTDQGSGRYPPLIKTALVF